MRLGRRFYADGNAFHAVARGHLKEGRIRVFKLYVGERVVDLAKPRIAAQAANDNLEVRGEPSLSHADQVLVISDHACRNGVLRSRALGRDSFHGSSAK